MSNRNTLHGITSNSNQSSHNIVSNQNMLLSTPNRIVSYRTISRLMTITYHIISYWIEIFYYWNTFLILFLSRLFEISTWLTLLIIPTFILMYSVGSFHSFHCFSYSFHPFGWIFFLFSRNDPLYALVYILLWLC